jgi:hypothetical protein
MINAKNVVLSFQSDIYLFFIGGTEINPPMNQSIKIHESYFIKWHSLGYFFSICFLDEINMKNSIRFYDLGLNMLNVLLPNGVELE